MVGGVQGLQGYRTIGFGIGHHEGGRAGEGGRGGRERGERGSREDYLL